MVELLIKIDPELYQLYAIKENGKFVLYAELLKALYGILKLSRLFWEKLTAKLQD